MTNTQIQAHCHIRGSNAELDRLFLAITQGLPPGLVATAPRAPTLASAWEAKCSISTTESIETNAYHLQHHLMHLMLGLQKHFDLLIVLRSRQAIDVKIACVAIQRSQPTPILSFSHDVLSLMANLGASFDIDLYNMYNSERSGD
jgi:hypothetical protein